MQQGIEFTTVLILMEWFLLLFWFNTSNADKHTQGTQGPKYLYTNINIYWHTCYMHTGATCITLNEWLSDTKKSFAKVPNSLTITWKVSVFGVILVRLFPAFPLLWTEYGEIFSPNARKCGKNADQNNSKYGHFLRRVLLKS